MNTRPSLALTRQPSLSMSDLIKVATSAMAEAEIVESPVWREALLDLVAAADRVRQMRVNLADLTNTDDDNFPNYVI